MKILKTSLFLTLGILSLHADTQNLFYIGSGISLEKSSTYKYEENPLLGGVLKVGYIFNDNLALELRGSKSLASEDKLEHSHSMGVFIKPMYDISEKFKLYGLLGYGEHKLYFEDEESFNGVKENSTVQNDFSYGVGVEYRLNKELSTSLEWIQLTNKKNANNTYAIKIQGVYMGLTYFFPK